MAAFDKILSGFPQMDQVLDSIRLGDNVVWQISDLDVLAGRQETESQLNWKIAPLSAERFSL